MRNEARVVARDSAVFTYAETGSNASGQPHTKYGFHAIKDWLFKPFLIDVAARVVSRVLDRTLSVFDLTVFYK